MSYAALVYESERSEPRLRRILGHLWIYENAVRAYREAMQKRGSCPGRRKKRMRKVAVGEDDVDINATIVAMRLRKDNAEDDERGERDERDESDESDDSEESVKNEEIDESESEESDEDEEREASESGNKDNDDNFLGKSEQAVIGRLELLLKVFASQDGGMAEWRNGGTFKKGIRILRTQFMNHEG
jgi:hypothetical protein